jgi:hypothetical protein
VRCPRHTLNAKAPLMAMLSKSTCKRSGQAHTRNQDAAWLGALLG